MATKESSNMPSPPTLQYLLSLPSSTRTSILQEALSAYPDFIPEKLQTLDKSRYTDIPELLKTQPHLTKPQLLTLLDWKLHHGTFRPTLRALVTSNPEDLIIYTIQRAIELFVNSNFSDVKTPLNVLCELRGIGPATASLVLSCIDVEGTVFFGDEVAEWVGVGGKGGKLKYTAKEYLELCGRVREVKGELGLSATEVEQVGYVFGKRAVETGWDEGKAVEIAEKGKEVKGGKRKTVDEGQEHSKGEKRNLDEERAEEETKDTKRKAQNEKNQEKTVPASRRGEEPKSTSKRAKIEKPALEGTRRSTRSKKT